MTESKYGGKPRIRVSNDGLANMMTGMGTERDRRTFNRFMFNMLQDFAELEAAYIDNWIARDIIDIPVDDSTREWREFASDDATAIREAEKFYNVQAVTQDAFKWAGVYGGAGTLMITDQPFDKPLRVKKIKKGSLKRLLVLDRMFINGQAFNVTNPLAENYMLPDYFVVNGGSQQIHYSHFVKAPGAPLPMRLRMINGGWDDSRLRRCLEDVKDAVSAKGGVAALIQEANIDVINRENLANDLAAGDMDDVIAQRYNIFGMMKSLYRLALLDKTEEFDRKQISFGGLGEILSVLMEWTAGAAGIPMTRLFGVQSKGLGDSGQGDMNNYYNTIRGGQESKYRPFLKRIDEVLIRSTLGAMPDGLDFEFAPLSQPTDTELSAQRLADAQADELRLQQGVVRKSQVARKLMEQGVYGLKESDIANLESDEKAERDGDYEFQLAEFARANGENANAPSSANPANQAE
ncbi:DUF1073 domain-containing protein [Pectobacterium brasiliense]|uniref:DUF1073 domain-containing protein n=1 Tax=Pectobacterium brasiliense TaxID=180957 RepID=A0A433NJG0_9GAMM|nr:MULTISPECIES: DUF1073 domain-containing protein [Pectobacterium]GKW27780.1 hypothetical protein PEC331060_09580 [Pectobacterium carotovorum subsp. carotovorum]MBN3046520.1 DUF1073 domain-containing protein [Pectobacterium brasiliense]MBN3056773.1 DUF1073 domain-containing protein [Pectobacterium brasiliense]MBN3075347.1 DUF1073 domain-containing protein [Pectobacterium brasiliense]MBN3083527.1 DUF1073 domain-containing protein [Pectobacterium brasiliense]